MSSEGIGEAVEIMRVTIDGTSHFIKFAYESTKELAALVIALKKAHDANIMGNVPFDKLLKNCEGNVRLVKVPDNKKQEFADALTKYGVQFSQMVDLNLKDGYCEFSFAATQAPLVKSVTEQLGFGEIISLEDYAKNADEDLVEKYAKDLQVSPSLKEKVVNAKNNASPLEDMAKQINSTAKENTLRSSSSNVRYEVEQGELIYSKDNKVLIPAKVKSIDGKKMYISIDKDEVTEKDDVVSIFFNDKKKYNLVDSKNNVLDSLNGRKIREEMLRKSQRKSKKTTRTVAKEMPLKR